MKKILNIIFCVILLIIWIVAGGYITEASVYLGYVKNTDSRLDTAYAYAFAVSFVIWTLVLLAIVGICFAIAAAPEIAAGMSEAKAMSALTKSTKGASWVIILFLIGATILVMVTGILAAVVASNIRSSEKYDVNDKNIAVAYTDSIISACLSLVTVGILIIGMIVYIVLKTKSKNEAKQKLEALYQNTDSGNTTSGNTTSSNTTSSNTTSNNKTSSNTTSSNKTSSNKTSSKNNTISGGISEGISQGISKGISKAMKNKVPI